jgi:pimeloyl-ACP methyl ester carboxylesterase
VTAVILQSGYSSLRDGAQYTLPWLRLYPDWMFGEDDFDNVHIFRAHHPPLLLLAGNRDWILPAQQTQRIYDQACQPKTIHMIDGGVHNLASSQYAEVCAVVRHFLDEGR